MRRERRNLSSSVTRLEDRFARLDAVEKQLNEKKKAGVNHRKANTMTKDPEMEKANFTSADVQTGDSKSFKSTQVIRSRETALRSQVHDQIANSLSAVKSQVQSFLTQQQEAKSLPVDTAPEYMGSPREENASDVVGADSHQFVELFMDEKAYETRVQLGLIAKMVSPQGGAQAATGQVHHPASGLQAATNRTAKDHAGSIPRNREGSRPGSPRPTKANTSSPNQMQNRQTNSNSSIYVNQAPIQIKPSLLRAACSRPKTSGTQRSQLSSRPSSGQRKLFPSLNRSSQQRPATSKPMSSLGAGADSGAVSMSHHMAKLQASKDAVYTKEFYHLHVRILHSVSKLEAWEFDVIITDITYPNATKRHSIRNLRVNPSMYVVFHPPDNVVLSPVDDIPWVTSPESLFEHTLRIEVHSTYPNRTQVIDNVVFFGDTAPVELAIGK